MQKIGNSIQKSTLVSLNLKNLFHVKDFNFQIGKKHPPITGY